MSKGDWTAAEKALLRKLYPTMTRNQLAVLLGRSAFAVMIKASHMGLKKRKFKETPEIKYGAPHEDDHLPARKAPHITVVKHAAGTITTHRMAG